LHIFIEYLKLSVVYAEKLFKKKKIEAAVVSTFQVFLLEK